MSNITKNQDKSIERRTGTSTLISNSQALVELEPDQLRAVIGGATNPKIEITVKADGTVVIKIN